MHTAGLDHHARLALEITVGRERQPLVHGAGTGIGVDAGICWQGGVHLVSFVGNGASAPLHNPRYDFNDQILPVAASYWVHLTERFLATRPAFPTANSTHSTLSERPTPC